MFNDTQKEWWFKGIALGDRLVDFVNNIPNADPDDNTRIGMALSYEIKEHNDSLRPLIAEGLLDGLDDFEREWFEKGVQNGEDTISDFLNEYENGDPDVAIAAGLALAFEVVDYMAQVHAYQDEGRLPKAE